MSLLEGLLSREGKDNWKFDLWPLMIETQDFF